MEEVELRKAVRRGYAKIAKKGGTCCGSRASCCEGPSTSEAISTKIGYDRDELKSVPEGANLGLGCGNPVALASLRKGEAVLDLGSGAGLDCFLAAKKVGAKGKIIGVDMTPEMIDKARSNARKGKYANVEFRLGEIENLPVADDSVDVVISNCVINLSTNKRRVFEEAFRALRPGGRLMISDLVLLRELPEVIRRSAEAYVGCLAGAMMKGRYLKTIRDVGFRDTRVVEEAHFPIEYMLNDPTAKAVIRDLGASGEEVKKIANSIVSVRVTGIKPHRAT